jgi:F-type H+-transporting ATPase subunit delta
MIVASRYAKSLIDLAVQLNQLDAVRNDMRLIADTCRANRELIVMLESPVVKTDKKMAVFKKIFEGKISVVTLGFLNLLAKKRREGYIDDVAFAFDEQYKIYKNITSAVITTAAPIDETTRSKVLDMVKKNASGEVELIEKTDKSLIGGFILKVKDKQVDTSIKRKLNDLRKNFSENPYVPELN